MIKIEDELRRFNESKHASRTNDEWFKAAFNLISYRVS